MRTGIAASSWRRMPTRHLWPGSSVRRRKVSAANRDAAKHDIRDSSCADNVSMVPSSSMSRMCQTLFADYPLAVSANGRGGPSGSMVLALPSDDDVAFFVLSRFRRLGRATYSLRPWHAAGLMEIRRGSVTPTEVAVNAVTHGVPLPRDGSVFGWRSEQDITALVTVTARYSVEFPEPSWAVMPFVGLPEAQWPPFSGRRVLGHWFWEYHRTGTIVWMDRIIAQNSRAVYWVDTKKFLEWDSCVVSRDIAVKGRFTLHRGRYVYYEALRAGRTVPPLDVLLADPSKTDLASRFGAVQIRARLATRT